MEILSAPRGEGKTTKLVYELLDNPAAVIVVSTEQRKKSMRVIVQMVMSRRGLLHIVRDPDNNIIPQLSPAQRVDQLMKRIITCDDVRRGELGRQPAILPRHVMVDDLEDVLHFFLGADVMLATVSVR